MKLVRRSCQANQFELTIGPVRLDLSTRDVLKLKSLLQRSTSVYLDDLRNDEDGD